MQKTIQENRHNTCEVRNFRDFQDVHDTQDIQNSQKKSMARTTAWAIWMIASIFYAYQYILRVMPNIMINDILQQFNIDATTFGQYSGVYYIGYSLMHLPIGIMLDRFGPKKVMPICSLLTVVGSLPIIFSDYWIYPIIGRALIGMGSSAAILGAFKIIRMGFVEAKFTRMLSICVTIGLIGAIYGGGPVNSLCNALGYKSVTIIFAFIGLFLSAVAYIIIPKISYTAKTTVIADIKSVFASKKAILVCFFAGLMVGPLEGFADVWGTQYFKQVYGFEGTLAASLPSVIFLGMCFGAPLLSLIAEKTNRYFDTIIVSGAIMALSFFALLNGKMPSISITIMFAIVGVCCAYQIIAIYKASTYVAENVVGLTTAVANMIIMIFGYLFHTVIGWTIQHLGGTDNPQAFIYGISVIPFCLCISVAGFYCLSRRESKESKEK